ncbi:MAG: iron-sulfur cluster assembly scaffold protein [Nanoarchaeota archaeon]|nr:iron-sulfur cluster assembly scaffold protein [Nanoarchaeota archaeon]
MADSLGGMYNSKVMKRFSKPKFAGEIKNADGVGEAGNMRCGDVMRVYLKVKNNKITDIRFKTFGCVAAIAASDAMCQLARGKTLSEAMKITDKQIADSLGGLPCIKLHCSVLGSNALKKAIENYKKNKK